MAINKQCGPSEGATRQTKSSPNKHTEPFSDKATTAHLLLNIGARKNRSAATITDTEAAQ